jgi:hypothetical protein
MASFVKPRNRFKAHIQKVDNELLLESKESLKDLDHLI